jgi:TonB family protein
MNERNPAATAPSKFALELLRFQLRERPLHGGSQMNFASSSKRSQAWIAIVLASFGSLKAAGMDGAAPASQAMSFDRECKRSATQVLADGPGKMTAPRSSPEIPLQQPPHPPLARSRGEEGTVVLEIFVTERGHVAQVKVAESSGYAELDLAAMQVTERWRLTPGTVDGTPVCMWAKFAVVFALSAGDRQERALQPFMSVSGSQPETRGN